DGMKEPREELEFPLSGPARRGGLPTFRPSDLPASRPAALSVSQLLSELRAAVESSLGQLWVRGEVTSLKSFGNGAWFFTLRDNDNSIPCKMWKTYTEKMKEIPAEGTDVYVLATPSVWEKRGELHLRVVTLLPSARIGDHQLARERVRAALERDGLFALERKRALPAFPSTLAIVTSEDGAALQDIIVVARKRWPRVRLLVIAARVQGEGAPAELVRALSLVNRLKVDLCIVGRGGGAREDLLAFDDEKVCRAIAGLRVPSISAVGHETDI